jgi:hypothetical protein
MLFAVQELNKALNISDNNMLFLTGYSEGGYACLATHKLIQDKYSDKLHVTASSPMSGAYDMAGAQSEVMFRHYSRPHYLPYLLRAYNEVYNLVGPDVNVVYKQPYDTLIPKLFDGTHNINQIDKQLPSIPGDMIVDSFVKRYKAEVNFPLKLALKENSLCDWKPDAPVQLCYCDSDEQVTCKNSFAAYNGMKSKGAAHVTLRRAAKNLGHSKCAIVAMLDTKMYFDTFRKGSKYGNKGAAGKRILASIVRAAVVKQSKKQATEHRNRAQAEHKPGREGEKKG